ncbi:MAG: hypothetical protein Q7R96_02180 [Nanoarchaeota archaeon]|nr:hypothetical protein [Nanoarchaeota archaeon]
MPQDLNTVLSDFNMRIRSLEGKYSQFGERLLVVNQNMIEEYKRLMKELHAMEEQMRELRVNMDHTQESMKDVLKELSLFAKKGDVKVLEKYINLWDPLKFVSEDDVVRIINQQKKEVKNVRRKSPTTGSRS